MSVANNIQLIQKNIESTAKQAGRDVSAVKLIAVSKTRSVSEVQVAIASGLTVFGENTIQDAMIKIPVLGTEQNEWHFIGHLQSKKVKHIPDNFNWIHTIDSIHLAQKLSDAMRKAEVQTALNCLIQINVTAESSKSGINTSDLDVFFDELFNLDLPGLKWRGLMTIGFKGDDLKTRKGFVSLRKSLNTIADKYKLSEFDQLSMGMSDDYQIAIEEGATMIRLGTSIFG